MFYSLLLSESNVEIFNLFFDSTADSFLLALVMVLNLGTNTHFFTEMLFFPGTIEWILLGQAYDDVIM